MERTDLFSSHQIHPDFFSDGDFSRVWVVYTHLGHRQMEGCFETSRKWDEVRVPLLREVNEDLPIPFLG